MHRALILLCLMHWALILLCFGPILWHENTFCRPCSIELYPSSKANAVGARARARERERERERTINSSIIMYIDFAYSTAKFLCRALRLGPLKSVATLEHLSVPVSSSVATVFGGMSTGIRVRERHVFLSKYHSLSSARCLSLQRAWWDE